jgi:C4-dicarboxylate-specific signal transduction histidine kinase
MATSIAHEVRQPLFAMMTDAGTAVRLLQQNPPDLEQLEEALEGVTQGGSRASEIIDRIRSLVHKEDHPKKPLDLNKVAEDVIAFLQPELRRRGVTVSTDLDENLPPIEGNEIELQQVLLNLIINGAQAMNSNDGAARDLSVSTSAEDDFVELAVRDSGVGLAESQVEQLFEPFYTTKTNGIGMGLAINRTIVRAHGGRIYATQNAEQGATFRVRLPIHHQTLAGEVANGSVKQQGD